MEAIDELIEKLERWQASYEHKARVQADSGAYTEAVRYNHHAIAFEQVVLEARSIRDKHKQASV